MDAHTPHPTIAKLTPSEYCALSGLPVYRHAAWTDVGFGGSFRITLSFIGRHILHLQPVGYANSRGITEVVHFIRKTAAEAVPAGTQLVLIFNFADFRGSTLNGRRKFITMQRANDRYAAVIFCQPSIPLRISINLARRLYTFSMAIHLSSEYAEALKLAQTLIPNQTPVADATVAPATAKRTGPPTDAAKFHVQRHPSWSAADEDRFEVNFEVLNDNILHSKATGYVENKHIELIERVRRKVIDDLGPTRSIDFIVSDLSGIKGGNYQARWHYLRSIKTFHRRYPFKMLILYGPSRFIKTVAPLIKPLLPIAIHLVADFEQALAFIENTPHCPAPPCATGDAMSHTALPADASQEKVLAYYSAGLLHFLGTINWERSGFYQNAAVQADHPFFQVYEGIKFIKVELDGLIAERMQTETTLQELNEELEARVAERTAALEQANARLRAEIETRKRNEADLSIARQMAEAANQAKSDFLANMSHELRTPLNHIIGFTQIVHDEKFGPLNSKQKDYLSNVVHSGAHLLELVNDILDLSKVEAGKMTLAPSPVMIKALLQNCLNLIQGKAIRHQIALSLHADDLPATITADERKLKQILYNLLSNAVRFTPDGGGIDVTARCLPPESPTGPSRTIEISIADSGIGLAPEELHRIFEPFEQATTGNERRHQGTGLGLSLCKQLVALHGGKLWASSQGPSKGSTFTFTLNC